MSCSTAEGVSLAAISVRSMTSSCFENIALAVSASWSGSQRMTLASLRIARVSVVARSSFGSMSSGEICCSFRPSVSPIVKIVIDVGIDVAHERIQRGRRPRPRRPHDEDHSRCRAQIAQLDAHGFAHPEISGHVELELANRSRGRSTARLREPERS